MRFDFFDDAPILKTCPDFKKKIVLQYQNIFVFRLDCMKSKRDSLPPFMNRLEKNFYDSEENIEKVVGDAFKVVLEKEAGVSFRVLLFSYQ